MAHPSLTRRDWTERGRLYENTLYDFATPDSDRRYLRVRVMRDSATVAQGLETEYGATAELTVLGDETGYRRRKFVSSSGGYLNQNEYTLHFGLPDDPDPADPTVDLEVEVHVDFPNLPERGFWRVDRHVNPVLGAIDVAALTDREIVVYRSGTVVIDGVTHEPSLNELPPLVTAAGGLIMPEEDAPPLPDPVPLLGGGVQFIGVDFDTLGSDRRARMRELIVDGHAGPVSSCEGRSGNVFLWDVTDPTLPVLRAVFTVPELERNHRNHVIVDALLEKDHAYRMVAAVTAYRATPFAGAVDSGDAIVRAGIAASDIDPCNGASVLGATTDDANLYMSFRYGPLDVDPCDLCLPTTEMCDFDVCVPVPVPDGGLLDGDVGRDGGVGRDGSSRADGGPEGPTDDGGCGCRVPAPSSGSGSGPLLGLGLLGLGLVRRTSRRQRG